MATINKNVKTFIFLLIVLLLGFLVFSSEKEKQIPELSDYDITTVQIGDISIDAETVANNASRALGLSGRENLDENEGMIFVFDIPGRYNFWMKDMNFPLDIIWLDESKKIIYIEENLSPDSYPESFGPEGDAIYVLEVVSGFADKYGLETGDSVDFYLINSI